MNKQIVWFLVGVVLSLALGFSSAGTRAAGGQSGRVVNDGSLEDQLDNCEFDRAELEARLASYRTWCEDYNRGGNKRM